MPVECAQCRRYACRTGRLDALPEACPMHGPFPDFESLYQEASTREFAYHAARIEAEGYARWTRVEEVVQSARRLGMKRLGIAHCRDTRREATLAARFFSERGFTVTLPPPTEDCDPLGQALCFRQEETELNVIVGMCVGHDALFIRHSGAPVTSLVVRDVRLGHNPVAALYTRRGYLKSALYERSHPVSDVEFAGWEDEELDRVARAVRDRYARAPTPPSRVQEVMDFAETLGAKHLGIVFCSGLKEEAAHLDAILRTNGFTVSSACCKTGSIPKEHLGIRDEEKVRPGSAEMMCNPLAQAELLDREEVDLALLVGQCVCHDSATMAHLRAPAICIVAKDRVLAHNTVAALYAAEYDVDGSGGPPDGR